MEQNPKYLSINEIWNDRRDPHANPLSSDPRRMDSGLSAETSGLASTINFIYSPGLHQENSSSFSDADG